MPKEEQEKPAVTEKPITFCGSSLKDLRDFPKEVKEDCGYQLHKVQNGEQPDDFKSMATVGKGVEEIRVKDQDGIYRVIFTARFEEVVYVLHAFQKKTEETAQKDIDLAKSRFKEVVAERHAAESSRKRKS